MQKNNKTIFKNHENVQIGTNVIQSVQI